MTILFERPDRRIVVKLIAGGLLSAAFMSNRALSAPLVSLGEDRYFQWTDEAKNIRFIESLDFTLDQSFVPANTSVFVRADRVVLSGALSLPGNNFTLCARKLTCTNNASISTRGKIGSPNYTGAIAQYGADGANDAGNGMNGGSITILVGELEGLIELDSSGGNGGGAQSGSDGSPGSPGAPASYQHGAQNGTPGHLGGRAGKPGNGGNAGTIRVGSVDGLAKATVSTKLDAGPPGVRGHNGKSGKGGLGGAGASGNAPRYGICPIQ